MNARLYEQLASERSKANIEIVASWAGTDSRRIADLFEIALGDFPKVSETAMWALLEVADNNNGILDKYATQIVDSLDRLSPSGMRRMACRILMVSHVPDELDGQIVDFCFRMLEKVDEPIGVKTNCLSLIAHRLRKYPELKQELMTAIDIISETSSTSGFRSRLKNLGLVESQVED